MLRTIFNAISPLKYEHTFKVHRSSFLEPPPEVVEKERELREKNRNFDKKNPWGEVAAEWASPKKGGPRSVIILI